MTRWLVEGSRSVRQRGRIGSARARKSDLPSVSVPVFDICIQMRVIGAARRSAARASASAKVYTRDVPIEAAYTGRITHIGTYHSYVVARNPFCTVNKTSNNSLGTSNICSSVRPNVKLRCAVKKDHCIYVYAILLIDSCLFTVKFFLFIPYNACLLL